MFRHFIFNYKTVLVNNNAAVAEMLKNTRSFISHNALSYFFTSLQTQAKAPLQKKVCVCYSFVVADSNVSSDKH